MSVLCSAHAACLVPPPLEVAEEDNAPPELLPEGLVPAMRQFPVEGDTPRIFELRVEDPDVGDDLYLRVFLDGTRVDAQGPIPNPGRRASRRVTSEIRPCTAFDPDATHRFVLAVVADRPFEDTAGEQDEDAASERGDPTGEQDGPPAFGPYEVEPPGVAVFNDWIVDCVPAEGS